MTEFQVNSYSMNNQIRPEAANCGKNYLVVWQSAAQDGSEDGVYGQVIDMNGSKLGSEFQINSYTTGEQSRPTVASNGITYLVVWQSAAQDGDNFGVCGQFLRGDGQKLGSEFQINLPVTGEQSKPNVSSNGSNYVISYYSDGEIHTTVLSEGYFTSPSNPDTDNDGMSDGWEIENKTYPLINDMYDYDNDGLSNRQEFLLGTNAYNQDTDEDCMSDSFEVANNFNPLIADLLLDLDNDGLTNIAENAMGTDPLNPDSDNDGLTDGAENFVINPEFQINTYTTGRQEFPAIATNGANYFITWTDEERDGNYTGIFGQLYDLYGSKIGQEFQINTYTTSYQNRPVIATDGANYLVVWQSYNTDGSEYNIYGQMFNEQGIKINSEILFNTYPVLNETFPAVASNGKTFFVAWQNSGIYGQMLNSSGEKTGAEFRLNTSPYHRQRHPSIAACNENYLVSWTTFVIHAQLFNSSGSKIGQELKIGTSHGYYPHAASAQNTYFITWQAINDGNENGISGQLYDSAGNEKCSEFRINSYTTANQQHPYIASNGESFIVAWCSYVKSSYEVFAQRYNFDGGKIGSEFQVNDYTSGTKSFPKLTYNGNKIFIVWQSNGQDGDDYGIYGKFITHDYGTDPLNPDSDNDGLNDGEETLIHLTSPLKADTDGDGLSDAWEIANNSDPLVNVSLLDNDNDRLLNGDELDYGTDPLNPDSDNDTMPDGWEVNNNLNPLSDDTSQDNDNDGLTNFEEYQLGTFANNTDSDGDGVHDGWEVDNNLNPLSSADASFDPDNDGLSNLYEFQNGTLINNPDSDNDGMPDAWEVNNDLNPLSDDTSQDNDHDGLTNFEEYQLGTFANNTDSDGDGMPDGWEVDNNFDPLINDLSLDNDNDGLSNFFEIYYGTSVNNIDSDNDGLTDYDEIYTIEGCRSNTNEFQINSYTNNYQRNSNVTSDGINYLVTWQSLGQDGNEEGIYAQLFSASGNKIGTETRINTYTSANQKNPYAASNGTNYFITWQSVWQDGSEEGVYGQLLDLNGNKIGSEFHISTRNIESQRNPSIATDNNNYFVTWQSYWQDGSYQGVYGQLYDSTGNKIGSEFRINSYTTNSQNDPDIACNGNNYLVTWHSNEQIGNYYEIYGQFYSLTGSKIGSEFRVNSYTTNEQKYSSISTDGTNYFVTWYSLYQDGSSWGIFGQLYSDDGIKIGQEFQINQSTLSDQLHPNTASNGNNFLVTWDSYPQDGDGDAVIGQFYSSTSEKIGSEFQINQYTMYSQEKPSVASNGTSYFIAWESIVQDGDDAGIIGRIIHFGSDPLNQDTDNDGLNDGEEVLTFLSDPLNNDTDGDGMPDGWEVNNNLNPVSSDDASFDPDNDGLSNTDEFANGTLSNNPDSDNDGMPDGWEVNNNLNPLINDTSQDKDNDRLTNIYEYLIGSLPNNTDSDNDGMPDGWEVDNNLNPVSSDDALLDPDNDGLSNTDEFAHGTLINNPDSDNDGMSDGWEVANNFDPLVNDSQFDYDNDGLPDSKENFPDVILDFQTNSYTTNIQTNVCVASDGTNYFAVWQSFGQNGMAYEIYGQIFDNEGTPIGGEKKIGYTGGTGYCKTDTNPYIYFNGSVYIVAWQALDISGGYQDGYYQIQARLFDTSGNSIKNIFVNSNDPLEQSFPVITGNNDYFLIAWRSNREGETGSSVYAQLLDNSGDKIGTEFRVNTWNNYFQYNPACSCIGDKSLVVWQSQEQEGTPGEGIFANILDNEGNMTMTEFQVNSYSLNNQIRPETANCGKNYLVVWQSAAQDGSEDGVYGQFIAIDGSKLGTEFQVNSYTTGEQSRPTVASNGENYLVVWQSAAQDGDNFGVYGQFFHTTGQKLGAEFRINNVSIIGEQSKPSVSTNGTNYVISYYNNGEVYTTVLSDGYFTDPANPDTDNDGMPDGWEIENNLNPLFNDTQLDNDNDGLSNLDEFLYGTYANNSDSDNDSMSDGWEVNNNLNPIIDDTLEDQDNDGLYNLFEFLYGTYANNSDSDNDGISDYEEIYTVAGYRSITGEFQINSYTTNYQRNISLATDGFNYLVTWQSYGQDESYEGIYGQLFNSNGNKIGTEIHISTYTSYDQRIPYTASNGVNYMVTWHSDQQDGSGYGIYGQLLDLNGNKIGAEFQINTTTYESQSNSDIATDGVNYFIAWQSYRQDGSYQGVYGQFYDSTANKIGSEFQINTYTHNAQCDPSIACNGNNFLVTWHSETQDGSSYGIYGQLLDLNGNKIGAEFQINSYTTNDQKYPSIAANGSNYFVTWYSLYQDGNNRGIFGQLYDSEGNPAGSEFQINSYTANAQDYPVIASNGNNFLVSWHSYLQDGSGKGVYGQFYDSNGTKIGSEFQINDYTYNSQEYPSIASNGNNFFIAWESYGQDGDRDAVMGKIIITGSDPSNPDTDNDGLIDGDEALTYLTDPLNNDTDGDGMHDGWEINNNLDPLVNDSQLDNDNDGLSNLYEFQNGTLFNNPDSDNDGMPDGWEVNNDLDPLADDTAQDEDSDGLTNLEEYLIGTSANDTDSDGDGLPDGWEVNNNFNPLVNDSQLDTDNDGLSNIYEFQHGTLFNNSDSDNDGMPDGWEVNNNLDPLADDTAQDYDNDGLTNLEEYLLGTSPNNNDTDGDGLPDVWEVNNNLNPLINDSQLDNDNDGLSNIQELQNGTLFNNPDSDNDGMTDGWEVNNDLDPLVDDTAQDEDNDGLTNLEEYQLGTLANDTDSDSDGLPDGWEVNNNLNPLVYDSLLDNDNDGLSNLYEFQNGILVNNPDSDNDGMTDGWEVNNDLDPLTDDSSEDKDNDGLTNLDEYQLGTLANNTDSDSDGLPDGWEVNNNFNPLVNDSWLDNDNDGLSNLYELQNGTLFDNPDSDNDGMTDGWEVQNNLNPVTDDSSEDSDNDGLTNLEEFQLGTLANNIDSDSDGLNDYDEITIYQTLPNNNDTDNDGLTDYDEIFTHFTDALNPDSDNDGLIDSEEITLTSQEFQINTYTTRNQRNPNVSTDGENYFVTWDSYRQDGSYEGIYGQLFTPDGNKISSELHISTRTSYEQERHVRQATETIILSHGKVTDKTVVVTVFTDNCSI